MLAVKSVNVRDNFKEWCDKISKGETVVISRTRNENIYMINEAEYNALQKAKRNAEYMEKINESVENHKKGDTISFTMEELRAMESEDWKPEIIKLYRTSKSKKDKTVTILFGINWHVLNFMQKNL